MSEPNMNLSRCAHCTTSAHDAPSWDSSPQNQRLGKVPRVRGRVPAGTSLGAVVTLLPHRELDTPAGAQVFSERLFHRHDKRLIREIEVAFLVVTQTIGCRICRSHRSPHAIHHHRLVVHHRVLGTRKSLFQLAADVRIVKSRPTHQYGSVAASQGHDPFSRVVGRHHDERFLRSAIGRSPLAREDVLC